MNTVSKKKTMLACLLAAALGASTCAGGLLLKADAADLQVKSADLFTASQGVNVLSASQYERPTGEKSEVGLRFQSQNDEAFTIELNGVFHRSFGLDWAAPADGWVEGGAEVIFEIAEFGNPENKFEIHYKGLWQNTAWVQYDYTNAEGQSETLYRTYGLSYQGASRMVYSKEIIDGAINSPGGSDILFAPELTAVSNGSAEDRRKSRTEVRVQNSGGNGVSMADDGAIVNVVGCSGGSTVPIASFRDDPESFSPTDEAMEVYASQQWWDPSGDANYKIGYNLPRINFDNGYTVKIHVSKGLEFMVFSIGEIMDNDYNNYWTCEPFNTWPAMQVNTRGEQAQCADETNAATYWSTVSFYQKWLTAPFIELPEEKYVAAGEDITPPAATYATNGNPSATTPVTDIDYRVNGGDWSAVSGGVIPACETGDEVDVRYNVPWNNTTISEIITLSVRNMTALSAQDVVRVKDAKVTANGQGLSGTATQSEKGLLLEPTIEPSYTFDLVGRFTGNTELRWGTAAEEDWDVNGRVEFTIAEAGNPENYFKVVWLSPNQSRAYVEYVYNGMTLYCAQGRNNSGTYYYVLGTGENHDNAEIADNWDVQYQPWIGQASSSGVLGLEWNGDVLNVMATNESGSKQILASFENDLNGFTSVTEGTGNKSNLPKISFANGYTVSVKVTGAIDFLLYDVTTAEGTESFDTESFAYEPVWYTRGKAMPVFDDIPVLPGVQVGSDAQLTVPELKYTAGEGAALTVKWIKPDNSESIVNVGDALTMTDKGDHIIRYTVTVDGASYVRELTVHACDYTTYVSGTPETCVSAGKELLKCVHGNTLEKVIPVDPAAHVYLPHWTWDGETPSVEFFCTYCRDAKQATGEITVTEIEDQSVASTCLTQGKKALKASVSLDGMSYYGFHEVTLPLADHSYGEPAWTWNGYDSATAAFKCSVCGNAETVTAEIKVEEDTENNVRTYTATVTIGDKTYTDVKTESISAPHTHTLKAVAEKAATCTEAGNKAYWECEGCGKLFLDAEGKTETTLEDVILPAAGHSYGEPAWTWNGYDSATAAFKCSVCGNAETVTAEIKVEEDVENDERTYTATVTFGEKTYTDVKTESIFAPHTHTLKAVAEKAATCTEAGNKAYWECSECGKLFLDAEGKTETTLEDVTLPATGQHNMVQVPAKAPTCTEDGNSAYYKCSECGRCSSDDKGEMEIDESSMVLKAKGHTFEDGKCTVCGAEDPDYVVPEEGLTGGQIAAIVVAAVVVAAGVVVAVVLVVRKKKLGGQK